MRSWQHYICNGCARTLHGDEFLCIINRNVYCKKCAQQISSSNSSFNDTEQPPADEAAKGQDPFIEAVDARDHLNNSLKREKEQARMLSWEEIYNGLCDYVIGQDRAKRKIATALYEHLLRINSTPEERELLPKANIIICGESGTGKTELFRAASKILDIPIVIADATTLTGPGYRGDDIEDYLGRLYLAADCNIEKAQKGIIFLDESDKIVCNRDNDQLRTYGQYVQQSILKTIEGKTAEINEDPRDKKSRHIPFDTSGVLFVFAGAHNGIRSGKNKLHEKRMGFGIPLVDTLDENEKRQELQPEDFINYGYIPELISRVPNIVELESHSAETLYRILIEPKTAVTTKYMMLAGKMGVFLTFSDDALRLIADESFKLNIGARGIMVILEKVMEQKIEQIARKEITRAALISRTDVEEALNDNNR